MLADHRRPRSANLPLEGEMPRLYRGTIVEAVPERQPRYWRGRRGVVAGARRGRPARHADGIGLATNRRARGWRERRRSASISPHCGGESKILGLAKLSP